MHGKSVLSSFLFFGTEDPELYGKFPQVGIFLPLGADFFWENPLWGWGGVAGD
jgi:hypothetical protein